MIHLSYAKSQSKRASRTGGTKYYYTEAITMQDKNYITYEYKTLVVKADVQAKTQDMYEAFGWEVTDAITGLTGQVTLSFRRDRKQKHKQELCKIERQAEEVSATIQRLKQGQTSGATIFGYIFGTIGALIFGGGLSLVLTQFDKTPALIGGCVLGVAGAILCGICYPIYKKIAATQTAKRLPLIDENEEKLANLIEKGNDLLQADII